jgi:hypothetical protein
VHLAYANSIEVQVRMVYSKYGIKVHYEYDRENFFPQAWRAEPINAAGVPINQHEAHRVIRQIDTFLASFPLEFIKRNLKNIYLLNDMTFYGKPYGKTNGRAAIYIESKGIEAGYTDDFILKGLYHEFSSIIMQNYRFPFYQWEEVNVSDFSYSGTGREILDEENLNLPSEELLKLGFLTKYSTSSLENDFNVFSEWIFTNKDELEKYSKRYPRIARKLALTKQFYNSVTTHKLIH